MTARITAAVKDEVAKPQASKEKSGDQSMRVGGSAEVFRAQHPVARLPAGPFRDVAEFVVQPDESLGVQAAGLFCGDVVHVEICRKQRAGGRVSDEEKPPARLVAN